MKYYSLHNNSPRVSFKEAVIRGIAPDRGLYFPEAIRPLEAQFFSKISSYSNEAIAMAAIRHFVEPDIPEKDLLPILTEVLDFPFPVVEISESVATLELFHGPTLAFKDVGARFMARCLGYFSKESRDEITVLVATSGDTGGAVANGFLKVPGVQVVILYPKGKVSDIQERQLTTLGHNILAVAVEGTFDDCQRMVKTAFLDETIRERRILTSANSINVARWLPQMFYFLFAYKAVQKNLCGRNLVFSVPSGNFGNLCAGMLAARMGLPVAHFVAATNINDTVPRFMDAGRYDPRPSRQTISNAMDVGDPSNFDRIRHLFEDNIMELQSRLSAYAFTDTETREAIRDLHTHFGYTADPHGAVGYLGLRKYQELQPNSYGIFLETAHPLKFREVVEEVTGETLSLPPRILQLMEGTKKTTPAASYEDLKHILCS